jgi:rubrerythrin
VWLTHDSGTRGSGHLGLLILLVIAILLLLDAEAAATRRHAAPQREQPAPTMTPIAPDVRDTPTNLQAVFTNELNAKERYVAFGKQADAEGYAAVANLFRACAAAEDVHAHRHVVAIGATGGQARAVLERVQVSSTADNLRTAITGEQYEVDYLYPALVARARGEHRAEAVRSMTFALAAEREHVQLFTAALAGLEAHATLRPVYVCRYCGRTTGNRPQGKCPNCFTPSKKSLRFG